MSIPYHRPISAQLTQDEDYFLKDMPESILPPTPPQHEKGNSGDDGDAGQGARGDSNMSEEQIKELKRYREVIKGMGRELSNLQSTVTKLQTENQSLRKNSASDEQLMSIILTDPSVEVDSPEDFVERYVALKTRLEADLEEFKTYKDNVQKLQNQLIRANDREKNFLHFEVAHGNEEERVKPVNKERQKIRKLQYTVIQQENAIKNLEKALRDYLDRTERRRSAKSAVSSTSSKFGSTVTIRDPHQDAIAKLMEENARLREDIGDYRILMQEDDLKNLQLNEDLALSDQRIESLIAQLNQNEQNWACEKRELTVRLQEQKSNLAHSVNASVIDVGSRHAFWLLRLSKLSFMDFTVAQCVDVSSTRNTSLLVDSVEEDDVAAHFFGFAKGNIVGIRYYAGMVNNKEMVALVREPANPYDRNAVRVNNIMGQQVGHIKREMARALAEVVDQGLASIEGVVPYGANNVYSMAVEISFWGAPENKERTSRIMAKYGFALMPYTQSYGKGNSSSQKKTSYESPHSRAQRLTSDQMKNELDGLFEKLRDVDQTVEEEACPAIKSNLYMHQKQAIAWMRKKETGDGLPPFWEEKKPTGKVAAKVNGQVVYYNSITNHMTVEKPTAIKGGILADDMGLGKTLITISLILGSSWNSKPIHGGERIDKVETDTELIIEEPAIIDLTCDGADIENVKEEIVEVKEEVTIESTDAITVTIPSTNKENIEVVTESAMENNLCRRSRRKTKRPVKYRDEIELSDDEKEKPKKQKKSTGGRTTQSSNVADKEYVPSQELASVIRSDEPVLKKAASEPVHYFVREPVPSDQPHTTLIICPLSLISNWVGQVEEHVHAGAEVKILVFHGPAKSQVTGKILMEQDIVITTYQTVAQELKRSTNTLLFKMKWLRVVLDEGHIIRNQKSQQSIACRTLKAERKWVLSGTPIQNSTKDLFAIVLFLGIDTFADLGWWQRTIQRPISNGDSDALKRIQCLLSLICIRRTKSQKVNGKPIVTMPGKDTFVQHIDLDSKERQMYEKMNAASKRMMKSYMESDSRSNGYADMLVYIMRLRQICCHPSLAKEALEGLMSGEMVSEKEKQLATKLLCMIEAGSLDDCCICLDSITSPVISRCSHVFCKLCIAGVVTTNGQNYLDPRCPLCRSILRQEDLVEPPMENEELDENVDYKKQPSSKVHALMHELLKLNKEDPSTKSLVVSQFTEFLKIIQQHLIDNNIPFVLYHGGMTRKAREEAIWQLQCGQAKVMLMTLKAGGVGLNLTAASQVFLMEPSWNPAAEDQCFDRVYRLGQTKSVRITKFICKNTVEERMVEMQSRKRELAKASLQRRTAAERKQQTVADLRRLMES